MLIKLKGGRVFDPANGVDGETRDLLLRDGRIVADASEPPDRTFDVFGKVVMAGAIDIHSHIAGGKMNIARALLPATSPGGDPTPSRQQRLRAVPRGAHAASPAGTRRSRCHEALHRHCRLGGVVREIHVLLGRVHAEAGCALPGAQPRDLHQSAQRLAGVHRIERAQHRRR